VIVGRDVVTPTAYDLVARIGRVEPGDRVLIHAAAGGVGTLAVQFARAAHAANIVGVVATEGQMDYARRFGLDDVGAAVDRLATGRTQGRSIVRISRN
jgi:NADPH:quinone reductase-like Zn-dependent oxidoreductase